MSEREFDTAVYVYAWNPETYRFDKEAEHRDADVRQVDRHGVFPGAQFQLRLPSIDDETGEEIDVDGDRSYDREYLHAADVRIDGRGSMTLRGFQPEERDRGRGMYPTGNFRLVEWHVLPFSWIKENEREAAEDATLAETLTVREQEIIVGIRTYEQEAQARAQSKAGYTNTWLPFPKASESAEGYLPVELPNGIMTTFEEVTGIRVGGAGAVMVSHEDKSDYTRRGRVYHRDVSLLTRAVHVADALMTAQE